MKLLIATFTLFLTTITFAQSTDYHSKEKLGKKLVEGKWFNSGVKEDGLIMYPSPVAYAKVYRELKKALDFYDLQFDSPLNNESVISSLCKSIEDFETMDFTIKMESSEINMVWKNSFAVIVWICKKDAYALTIKEL